MQTDTVIIHPDVEFYDFYEAYDDPIEADTSSYLGMSPLFRYQNKANVRRLSLRYPCAGCA